MNILVMISGEFRRALLQTSKRKKKMPVFELFIDFTFSLSSGLKSCAVEKFSHFGLWFVA